MLSFIATEDTEDTEVVHPAAQADQSNAASVFSVALVFRVCRSLRGAVVPSLDMAAHDITDQSAFTAIGEALLATVEGAVPKLRAMSESRAERSRAPGKWSPKQVIGHLIDSASNNHQRFVRAQEGPAYTGLRYEQ